MLNWTITFLILALATGVLGFTSLAGPAAIIAQILFASFLVLLIISGFSNIITGRNS